MGGRDRGRAAEVLSGLTVLFVAACGHEGFDCVPESDAELCARVNGCEQLATNDGCGKARAIDCGACAGGDACIAGACQPLQCSSLMFAATFQPQLSTNGSIDGIISATPDGNTVIHHSAANLCGPPVISIADANPPGSFNFPTNLMWDPSSVGFFVGPVDYSISADGLTVIGVEPNRNAFAASTRTAKAIVDFGALDETAFAAINATTATDIVSNPVLSSDGLAFYYATLDSNFFGSGVYQALRASKTEPFGAPALLAELDPTMKYVVTGISDDRMTLFLDACPNQSLSQCWWTDVWTRHSLNDPFANPVKITTPGFVYVWNQVPINGCASVLATIDLAGGCQNQDIGLLTRQ